MFLIRNLIENLINTAVTLAQTIELELGSTVHAECVRRVLRKSGYNGRNARRKPHISDANTAKRLEFACKYENEECSFWDKVLFADETKVKLFQSND
ncbi:hypothetical protein Trydic_g4230 [Trypoxylus dichotomus]